MRTEAPAPTPQPSGGATRRQLLQPSPRAAIFACASVAFALLVGLSFWYQRFQPLAALAAAIAWVLLVREAGWWPDRRRLALVLAIDITLIFVYLWSLDERVHIVIHATPSGYVAEIDGQTATVRRHVGRGWVGLLAGAVGDYRIGPQGEAYPASPTTPLARFEQFIRFAGSRSAWTDVRLIPPRGVPVSLPFATHFDIPAGSWTPNRRGELEGALGSYTLLAPAPGSSYTVEADLVHPDGTQGLLVGVDSQRRGYIFAPRMDQPDALWFSWDNGQIGPPVGGTALNTSLPALSMIQRDLRLLLGNVIVALLLLLVAVPAYAIVSAARAFGSDTGDGHGLFDRLLTPRVIDVAAALAAVGGLIAVALVADRQLRRIPHVQDSVAYLFQAKTLALGRLWAPAPRHGSFFTFQFILMDGGRWFGIYSPGWPLLLAVGVLFHAPWLVNPVLAGADIYLIYLVGREAYGRGVGLLAALLALSSPLLLFLSGDMMAHTATLFYLSAAAALFVRWARRVLQGDAPRHEYRLLLPAGCLLGMGILTRQLDAVAFALPLALLLPLPAWRRRYRALGWVAAGAAAPVIALLLYNWVLAGSPFKSTYALWSTGEGLGFRANFPPSLGLWNMSWNLESLLAHLWGWPYYFTLALALVPFLLGRVNRWDVAFGASAAAIMLGYILYWGGGVMYGPRYYFCCIPALALLTARGLQELYRWLLSLPLPLARNRPAALAVPALIGGLLLACNLTVYLPAQARLYNGYNGASAAALDAVRQSGIHHALVFVAHPDDTWQTYGMPFSANSPLLDGDIVYARDLGASDRQLAREYPDRKTYRLDGLTVRPFQP